MGSQRSGTHLSRRAFLAGSAGAAFLLACGGNGDDAADDSTDTTAAAGLSLVKFFGDDFVVAGKPQRVTFGLGDAEGVVLGEVPATLDLTLLFNGETIGPPVPVASRNEGIPRPYYPLEFNVADPGVYTAATTVDGEPIEASFQVLDAGEVRLPQVGDPLPAFDIPTVDDHRGVDPICTRDPECPLHDLTLAQALAEGRPIAFSVSTPEFCQVAICGPVLDVLLEQQPAFPHVRMLHAEVYTDRTTETLAPVIDTFGLTFEPTLFLAGADGTIAARLDNIYDTSELVERLQSLPA
jgi:hypothetical protein